MRDRMINSQGGEAAFEKGGDSEQRGWSRRGHMEVFGKLPEIMTRSKFCSDSLFFSTFMSTLFFQSFLSRKQFYDMSRTLLKAFRLPWRSPHLDANICCGETSALICSSQMSVLLMPCLLMNLHPWCQLLICELMSRWIVPPLFILLFLAEL